MQEYPNRNVSYTDFILIGLSGSKEWKQLLFMFFLLILLISVPANLLLIFIITSQRCLHSPMYILMALMSCIDLTLPAILVPNVLVSILFNWTQISLVGCLIQMFFIHFIGTVQSTVLLWMSLDRYYAICIPLHYNDYMAVSAFMKFVILPLLRNAVLIITMVGLAASLAYCQYEINHCLCEHMALVSLACGTITANNIVGLTAAFGVTTTDFILITASYGTIFFSVFKSGKSTHKALSTCVTHIIVMTVTLVFALTAFLSYRIKSNMTPSNRTVISAMYLLFPSCFDPIIYGIRTKEIRQHILKVVKCGTVTPQH